MKLLALFSWTLLKTTIMLFRMRYRATIGTRNNAQYILLSYTTGTRKMNYNVLLFVSYQIIWSMTQILLMNYRDRPVSTSKRILAESNYYIILVVDARLNTKTTKTS